MKTLDPVTYIKALSRIKFMISHVEVQAWLSTKDPRMLLVDGNTLPVAKEKISAMSLFGTTLDDAMKSLIITLSFFCGVHTAHSDSLHGPHGLVRCLIT